MTLVSPRETGGSSRVLSGIGGKLQVQATVIVNADDWGRDINTSDRSLQCFLRGTVSSVSAMVFMEDSERAAHLAQQHLVDAGLHLNLTMPFSAQHIPIRLAEHQRKLCHFLRSNRFAKALYNPCLATSFEYVVKAQLEEFERLYGSRPNRIDGHHHMHLCANVLAQRLMPTGVIVRKHLSFNSAERGYFNRAYRGLQDRWLARRYRAADFLFCLQPTELHQGLERIFDLANCFNVEVETHPVRSEEYRFLMEGEFIRYANGVQIARGYLLPPSNPAANVAPVS